MYAFGRWVGEWEGGYRVKEGVDFRMDGGRYIGLREQWMDERMKG